MALTENKIDDQDFIALSGTIIAPVQAKMVDDRPGVDGSEFLLAGRKGKPFTLISQVDCESYEDAKAKLEIYQAMIEGDAVNVVQGGVDTESRNFRCVILDVQEVECRTIRGAVGFKLDALNQSQGFLIARWELVGVPIPEE